METLVVGMRKTIGELVDFLNANHDIPDSVRTAIRNYRGDMLKAIEEMTIPPFELEEKVELISSSYEDNGYLSGMTGKVREIKSNVLPSGFVEHDVRVAWDNDLDECWIDAADFSSYYG